MNDIMSTRLNNLITEDANLYRYKVLRLQDSKCERAGTVLLSLNYNDRGWIRVISRSACRTFMAGHKRTWYLISLTEAKLVGKALLYKHILPQHSPLRTNRHHTCVKTYWFLFGGMRHMFYNGCSLMPEGEEKQYSKLMNHLRK